MSRRGLSAVLIWLLQMPLSVSAQPALQADREPTDEQLSVAVEQLGSSSYDRRVQATELLVQSGQAAIPHLAQAVDSHDLDRRIESLRLLRRIYDSHDYASSCQAGDALQRLTQHPQPLVADFANDALQSQADLAIDRLKRLGAKFQSRHSVVELGTGWKGEDRDAMALRWVKGLQTLRILNVRTSGKVLAVLQWLPDLRELVILNVPIGDDALVHLQFVSELRILYLTGTRVSGSGMQYVGRLRALVYLDISHTEVDADGVAHLHELTKLKTLDIGGLQLPDSATRRLKSALSRTKILAE